LFLRFKIKGDVMKKVALFLIVISLSGCIGVSFNDPNTDRRHISRY
jgi:uncharacterized protein YceK